MTSDYEVALSNDRLVVCHGEALSIIQSLPDDSIDAVITDPPYSLSFMGKDWDSMHPDPLIWKECQRVLKPGGYLLSFGGTRTWHRLACDIEDAGFEIRDSVAWLYGSGFPKSMDVSKAIDKAAITAPATDEARQWEGWGTALKPAFEPIIVARKPFKGTVAANVLEHGTGALNIDACRVKHRNEADLAESTAKNRHADFGSGPRDNHVFGADERTRASQGNYDGSAGRWPTNVVMDDSQAQSLDSQTKPTKSTGGKTSKTTMKNTYGTYANEVPCGEYANAGGLGDEGGVSRYFPTFKYQAKAPKKERPSVDGVMHPTVKPLELMRWLIRLVTAPGGTVLDPFAGSGTTGQAALMEGCCVVLCEREASYIPLIVQRLEDIPA